MAMAVAVAVVVVMMMMLMINDDGRSGGKQQRWRCKLTGTVVQRQKNKNTLLVHPESQGPQQRLHPND